MNSIRFTKNKIASQNLRRLRSILEVNPSKIHDVHEEKMMVVVHRLPGVFDLLYFDEYTWPDAFMEMIEEIETRPNPEDRAEFWECRNIDGHYSFDIHMDLIELRRENKPRVKNKIDRRALRQLTEAFNLPDHMGELFLNELKLSDESKDGKAKMYARTLELIND